MLGDIPNIDFTTCYTSKGVTNCHSKAGKGAAIFFSFGSGELKKVENN
jgi:hypothetical protein